jgi:hypothetical protein
MKAKTYPILVLSVFLIRCETPEKLIENTNITNAVSLIGLPDFMKESDPITTCFADTRQDDSLSI